MENWYPFKEIDIVLSIFKPEYGKLEVGETKRTLKNNLKNVQRIAIEERLLDEILDKLEIDKYLKSVSDGLIIRNGENFIADPKIYTLTLSGEMFLLSGGYVQQQKNIIARFRKDTAYTISVGVGTALAGLYALFEICLWVYRHFGCG